MKKLIFLVTTLVILSAPKAVLANDEQIICPQPYGGGVVCGVKTHKPVETGLSENLALAGVLALAASGFFAKLSKKAVATI